ncbi:ABC transporter [Enterobacter cloacae]|uniref:ABC transporter n=1 Tax=Enterobacter cloacae TaxID=550 RepID=A0A377M131_ENTCL|nr:ABC transporter [Enterobacter cloacae]
MQPAEGLFTRQLPGDRYREQTDPVLQLDKINVNFDGFQALTDLTLNIGVGGVALRDWAQTAREKPR